MTEMGSIAGDSPRKVDIRNIDDGPGGPYCMSFNFDPGPLADAIRRAGLINSPVLKENGQDKFDVVAGYRRIHAMKLLGWNKIPCRIVSGLPPLKCLLLNLYDNLSVRTFNDVEKAMILNRLLTWVSKEELFKVYMPLLGLPSHEPVLKYYLRIESEPDEDIRKAIADGVVCTRAARMLLEMDGHVKSRLCDLIQSLKFNTNYQIQLIELLIDISHKEKRSIPDIIDSPGLNDIIASDRMNNPQKINAILGTLRSRRFPRLVQAEERFKQMVCRLDLPEGVSIRRPPFFEAPGYRMEVFFENGKELERKIEHLLHEKNLATLRDPWEKIPHA